MKFSPWQREYASIAFIVTAQLNAQGRGTKTKEVSTSQYLQTAQITKLHKLHNYRNCNPQHIYIYISLYVSTSLCSRVCVTLSQYWINHQRLLFFSIVPFSSSLTQIAQLNRLPIVMEASPVSFFDLLATTQQLRVITCCFWKLWHVQSSGTCAFGILRLHRLFRSVSPLPIPIRPLHIVCLHVIYFKTYY